jgi:aldehyde:ferredoxin oxidoreductase
MEKWIMSAQGDYLGRVLIVDLTSGKIEVEALDEAFAKKYIGGRGFTSRLQYDLIPKDVDPLGPENTLIFAPGALTGSPTFATGRVVAGARSPLTGILGDANSGGFWGAILRRAGYSLILIRGRASKPVYIAIDDEQVEIRDASHLWGLDVYEAVHILEAENPRGTRVAAIGQAGENLVRIASIMVDKEHALARTGIGAVMGSKLLKAITVYSTNAIPLYDPKAFKQYASEIFTIEAEDKRAQDFAVRGTLGTLMDHHWEIGACNTRNYQYGQFEGKHKIDNDALQESGYLLKTTGCYRCALSPDKYCLISEGEFAGTEVGGPEYCTAVAFGSAVGNDNIGAVLKGNELANRYGMDTIDLGGVLAYSMELYERGYITKDDADGLDLTWGNYHTMLELVRRIAHREGNFANMLANGVHAIAETIGGGAERYAVHVKGMTPAPIDARVVKVYNFRYAVGPRGADHLRVSCPAGYALDHMPILEAAEKLRYWQSIIAIPDLMGICKFPWTYYTETVETTLYKMLEILPALYNAAKNYNFTVDQILETGTRVTNIERAHNARLGLTSKDDTLPPRFTEEPMPSGPAKGEVYTILEPMKKAWYTVQKWDVDTGIPTRARLEELDLADIAEDLEKHNIPIS